MTRKTMTRNTENRKLSCLIALLLLTVAGWTGGCASPTESQTTVPVPRLPETYVGDAETPSSFVAGPILIGSRVPHPARLRVVTEPMIAKAVVEYVVDEHGAVIAYRTIESNHPAFAEAVRAWICSARFVPGVKAGENVKVRVNDSHFVDVSRSVIRSDESRRSAFPLSD